MLKIENYKNNFVSGFQLLYVCILPGFNAFHKQLFFLVFELKFRRNETDVFKKHFNSNTGNENLFFTLLNKSGNIEGTLKWLEIKGHYSLYTL